MTSKRELLDTEDAAWHRIHALFDSLSPDAWEEPGINGPWTPRDLLAHIAVWHAEAECMLEAFTQTGELPSWRDTDAFNVEAYERCKDLSLHDVHAMSESARHRYREEAARLPDELTDALARVVAGNGHGHYADHVDDLTDFVKGTPS